MLQLRTSRDYLHVTAWSSSNLVCPNQPVTFKADSDMTPTEAAVTTPYDLKLWMLLLRLHTCLYPGVNVIQPLLQ
ncbi:unnamed protein product [Schistocephalus solidus]|uniref:Uncharacterized protein n=1 Tax=Schistocephalus solidus TaxID=70667 RepID=A0A183SX28_SCHSO|nr:unnamed protein product [Schistocephalus solidus]